MVSGAILFHWLQDSYNSAAAKEEVWENISWLSYRNLNATKYDDLSAVSPYVTSDRLDSLQPFTEITLDLLTEYTDLPAAKLGLITGLLLSFILNSKSHYFKLLQRSKFQHWLQAMVLRLLFVAVCLIFAIIVAPFIGMFITVLMCYRKMVHFYLKMTESQYVQLLEGLDAIWAVEDTSRSIINVLTFIEVEDVEEGSNLMKTVRKTIINCLATPPLPCAKLFYLRRQCLGYFYWERQTDLIIEDYIRPMITILPDYKTTECNSSEFPHKISEETLKTIVGELSNTMLPKDHAACWEILVGSQAIQKSSTVSSPHSLESQKLQYPVMFRIHHSLGDGIALIQLLVSFMTDIPTPSESLDSTCMHSPKPVPISVPTRKFQFSNNSKRNTLHMEDSCNIEENSIHQVQSPTGLNITQLKMRDRSYHSEGHCKTNDISINPQSIQENNTVIFHNYKKDEPEIILRSVPLHSPVKINSVTMKCKPRPLFLKNCSASVGQLAKFSFHEESLCKGERNTSVNSNQVSCPTSQPMPEFKTFTDCYSKIFGSCNQPLTIITTEKLSPAVNSNFRTSLPMLNVCKTPKNKSAVQQFSKNTFKSHYKNYDAENDLINSLENIRYQSPTQIKMLLEEPPILFNKTKSASSYTIPKSTFKLPISSKIPCSKSMTLHCYNHIISDSYITIPEDIVCSAIETSDKGTKSSTTLYYYPSATSSLDPISPNNPRAERVIQSLTNDAEVTSQKSIQYNKKVSPISNDQISLISGENNFSDSSSEERNVVSVAQTKSHSSIATESSLSLNSTSIKIDKCAFQDINYFGWDIVESEGITENGLQVQSTATKNSTRENYHTKNISTFSNDAESPMNTNNQYDYSVYTKKETDITLDNEEGHGFRRLKSDTWDQLEFKDTISTDSGPALQPDDPNQYVQLLNTISNSMCSLKKPGFSQFFRTICALSLSPASLIHQAMMKATDRNVLHGPPLTGYKVIAWHRDLNGDLFNCIKKLKSCLNARFTDVFLTALSASLQTYFETHQISYNGGIPGIVNVVIPARMEQPKYTTAKKINMTPIITRKDKGHSLPTISEEGTTKFSTNKPYNSSKDIQKMEVKMKSKDGDMTTFDLNNRFSVAMLQLPVSQALLHNHQGNEDDKFSPSKRLAAVCHNSKLLRKSLDYQINYWLLKIVASYLTKTMLSAIVNSSQSTLVVSNIMGPTQELSFAGSKLKDIIFWVPHRGTTGIGITVLSYMGHLEIGIMADRAVIQCKEDAQMILDEIVIELSKLDAASSETARSTQEIISCRVKNKKGRQC